MRVKFKTEMAEIRAIKIATYYFKGGQLFRDEQNLLALGEGRSNDVGDGLGFAGAGRPVNDKVLAGKDVNDRAVLRGIGFVD